MATVRLLCALLSIAALGCGSSDVSRELGARCTAMADCDERCLPPDSEFPDGFCTVSCLSDSDCPTDSVCVDVEGGVCLYSCAADAGCAFLGAGWTCQGEDRQGEDVEVTVCIGDD